MRGEKLAGPCPGAVRRSHVTTGVAEPGMSSVSCPRRPIEEDPMKPIRGSLVVAMALGVSCLAFPEFAEPVAHEASELDQKLIDARAVYQELLSTPDRGVPE